MAHEIDYEIKGAELHVDTGCLAAMTPSVEMEITRVGGVKSMIFGGERGFLGGDD